jgi:WD40 repeat protein
MQRSSKQAMPLGQRGGDGAAAAAAVAGLVANVIDRPPEVDPSACGTPSVAERVERLKSRLGVLRRRRQSKAVRAEMASARRELNALVKAPVSGGRDPFEWLPDELIVMIMLMLSFEVLWSGACERVCQRWARLMESAPVKRRKRDGRWAAYEAGLIEPRELDGHIDDVTSLAVGLDGKVYSGSNDTTIRVWSGDDGTHLQTIVGHTHYVCALAVGLDGKIYSGSSDKTIRVWSGDDGTHLQTLVGHTGWVLALAVGLDGKVYSGSVDKLIRVWSGDEGKHLQTLEGHTGWVDALAVGLDGKVYSASWDKMIRVWSGDEGTHLQTLEGHTNYVSALAVGLDGKVYSGSGDKTIRVWSGDDGAHVQTLVGHANAITALAVGSDGNVFSASFSEMRVWSCKDGSLLHTLQGHMLSMGWIRSVVFGRDGSLFSCCQAATLQVW